MRLSRFPILLSSTLLIAAAALLAPADGAEQRFAWGFFAPHVEVEVSRGRTCPPPAPVCVQPVYTAPIREIVWVDGFITYDAYGCRTWIPGHYEERYVVQPEYRHAEPPRCPPPPCRYPEQGGRWYHDDDCDRGHDDDRYRGHGEVHPRRHDDQRAPSYHR